MIEKEKNAIRILEDITYVDHFNPFKVMRNGDHEIRHSNTLAWLFDKREIHGLKSDFAIAFFKSIFVNVDWNKKLENWVTIETEVAADPVFFDHYMKDIKNKKLFDDNKKLEKEISNRRKTKTNVAEEETENKSNKNKKIDIFIEGNDFTITIENKFGSGEHDWQCQRYRHYINAKYPYPEYDNYFVFLDINEPANWWLGEQKDIKNLRYEGYELIDYEKVRNILETLIKDKEDNEAITYIRKYIEILDETYDKFNSDVEKVIIENIEYGEDIHLLKNLNAKLMEGKRIFETYTRNLQVEHNEEIVKNVLETVVNKEKYQHEPVIRDLKSSINDNLIQYHFGKAGVSDPYGYKLAIKDFLDFSKRSKDYEIIKKVKQYLNEIDYTAKYGDYKVLIYCGSQTDLARNWCEWAYDNFEYFSECLDKEYKKGCKIWIEYNMLDGHAQGSGATIKNFIFDYSKDNIKKLKKYWEEDYRKKTIGRIYAPKLIDNESDVLKMIREIYPGVDGKESKEYVEVKKDIKEYFSKSNNKAMTFRWTLALEYKINSKSVITQRDRDDLISDFSSDLIEVTRNGLNLFKLGDAFVKDVFER
ncbi:MAG: PD-(D/E)XK nuclease family protein [Lachnospiraceae bacterium]|nr:PD-(D/E)XK nuclease family protein [Lachnospiraceae bacterium]